MCAQQRPEIHVSNWCGSINVRTKLCKIAITLTFRVAVGVVNIMEYSIYDNSYIYSKSIIVTFNVIDRYYNYVIRNDYGFA